MLATDPSFADRVARLFCAEPRPHKISFPGDAVPHFHDLLAGRSEEATAIMALDRHNRIIDIAILCTGTTAMTIADPVQMLRWVLTRSTPATAFIWAHNHPSGVADPSLEDRMAARRISAAAREVGLACLDALVITNDRAVWEPVS
jgi:DNA repair protein RadC